MAKSRTLGETSNSSRMMVVQRFYLMVSDLNGARKLWFLCNSVYIVKRWISLRSALTLVILLWACPSYACDCATLPLAERVQWSSEVFLAEVLEYKPFLSVELRILESFKGASYGKLTVSNGPSECDYFLPPVNPRAGDQFLVFMSKTAERNTVSRCLGTESAASGSADIEILRNRLHK